MKNATIIDVDCFDYAIRKITNGKNETLKYIDKDFAFDLVDYVRDYCDPKEQNTLYLHRGSSIMTEHHFDDKTLNDLLSMINNYQKVPF